MSREKKQRIYPRFVAELPVEIITQAGIQHGTSVDLSIGGIRLRTSPPLEFGATVTLRFRLPWLEEDTVVESTVRWVEPDRAGLQFGSLRARDVWALNRLFRDSLPPPSA
ncbi:MAG: PilZ domain-containing protein [Myxococcales bacterium]|nr:PilZ domain-containing protein [Myxococcales bacterium]